MVTNQPPNKPFAKEAIALHQLNNERVEISVTIGKNSYSMVASGNALYIYGSKGELLETYLV